MVHILFGCGQKKEIVLIMKIVHSNKIVLKIKVLFQIPKRGLYKYVPYVLLN